MSEEGEDKRPEVMSNSDVIKSIRNSKMSYKKD